MLVLWGAVDFLKKNGFLPWYEKSPRNHHVGNKFRCEKPSPRVPVSANHRSAFPGAKDSHYTPEN